MAGESVAEGATVEHDTVRARRATEIQWVRMTIRRKYGCRGFPPGLRSPNFE